MTRRSAKVLAVTPAGPDHQVVTVARHGDAIYRRSPCPTCPWRLDMDGEFPPEAFLASAHTAYDMSDRMFACHASGSMKPSTCAGFLLQGSEHNLAARLLRMQGGIKDDVSDGGHVLHRSYRAMAVANGVAPDHPRLSQCRD